MLILVVAFVVLGPEDLLTAARKVGRVFYQIKHTAEEARTHIIKEWDSGASESELSEHKVEDKNAGDRGE